MSLCPSCVSGSPKIPYFPNIANGVLQAPTVSPLPGSPAAQLNLSNGLLPADPNNANVAQYATATTGGGLVAGHYQAYLSGNQVGGNDVAPIFDVYGNGVNYAILRCNMGIPLDPTRIGTTTGTGAPVAVACPSISATSFVGASFVGGALPPAAPVIALTNGVGFTINAAVGSIYNYVVFG